MVVKEILVIVAMATLLLTNPLFVQDPISKSRQNSQGSLQATCEDGIAALVNLNAAVIFPEDALHYSQKLNLLLRKIGQKYTTIIISKNILRIEMFKPTTFSIFLSAVAKHNGIRGWKELQPFKVYLYISVQSCYHDLENYVGSDGIISAGVIFQAYLIQNPEISMLGGGLSGEKNVCLNVEIIKGFLNSIQLTLSFELKMGLAVNSYEKCIALLDSGTDQVISLFDMVFFNTSLTDFRGYELNKEEMNYFWDCVKLFQEKYQEFSYYRVEDVFNFNN